MVRPASCCVFACVLIALMAACGARPDPSAGSDLGASNHPIIDSHLHVFSAGLELPNGGTIPPDQAFEFSAAEAALRSAGVDGAFVLSPGYIVKRTDPTRISKTKAANDALAQAIGGSTGQFWGFCGIPLFSVDDVATEIKRCAVELHFLGIKVHPTANGIDFRDPLQVSTVAAIIAEAGKWGLAVLIDGSSTPAFDIETARHFVDATILSNPETRLIIAHGLMKNHSMLAYIAEQQGSTRHVFTDVSAVVQIIQDDSSIDANAFVGSLRALGIDHVLWGSDAPILQMNESLEALEKLPLTAEERDVIRGTNALRFASTQRRQVR